MKLGVIGGMGSYASCYFYKKMLDSIDAKCDQDYLDMILLNHASIPDRTDYLLKNSENNPVEFIKNDIRYLEEMKASLILLICNTIYCSYDEIQRMTKIKVLNLVQDTILHLKSKNINNITLLATTGTIETGLYQRYCNDFNIKCDIINLENQNKIMDIIYNYIKIGKKINDNDWNNIINGIRSDSIVLGCTELSILKEALSLDDKFIDPIEVEIDNIGKILKREKKNGKNDNILKG